MGEAKRQAAAGISAGEPGSAYRARRSLRVFFPHLGAAEAANALRRALSMARLGLSALGTEGSRAAGGRPRPHLGTRRARTGGRPRSPSGRPYVPHCRSLRASTETSTSPAL